MEGGVKFAPSPNALDYLQRTIQRVPSEEQTRTSGEFAGFDDFAIGSPNFGAGGDVGAGFDDAVIAK